MDLVDFLRARIKEDEARIIDGVTTLGDRMEWDVASALVRRGMGDVRAKRRIIDLHCTTDSNHGFHYETPVDTSCRDESGPGFPEMCLTLRALAQPYADHPDFDQEWKL